MNKKRKENQVMVYGKVEHLIQTEDIIFVLYCFRVLSERAVVCILIKGMLEKHHSLSLLSYSFPSISLFSIMSY